MKQWEQVGRTSYVYQLDQHIQLEVDQDYTHTAWKWRVLVLSGIGAWDGKYCSRPYATADEAMVAALEQPNLGMVLLIVLPLSSGKSRGTAVTLAISAITGNRSGIGSRFDTLG